MRRHLLGVLSVASIFIGLTMIALDANAYIGNSLWRIGLVLAAVWLAFPQLEEMSRWFRRAAIVIAVVAAAMHKYALILLPLIFLMWVFGRKKAEAKNEQPDADHVG